jgi:ribose 5-phosphate isomerase A
LHLESMSLPKSDPSELGKAAAGKQAAEAVSPGMRLGLGTGSTVAHFLEALGKRFQNGELPGIIGVPTSIRTENHATELGIPLTTLESVECLDLTVDGADEVDPHLDLIKGLGGALLREKMVAQATRRLIIIADESKIVEKLGTRSPLPIEVVPFGWRSHLPFFEELGGSPVLRENQDGTPFCTDNGNYILDCRFSQGIHDPTALETALTQRAGIVESGLFLGMAQEVLVGGVGDVRSISR